MAILVPIVAFIVAFALCTLLIPLFRRAFLAIPDARSSHAKATPQGGGLVVIPTALILAFATLPGATPDVFAWSVAGGLLLLTALGGWDDLASLNPAFRLVVQAAAVALALTTIPHDFLGKIPFIAPALVLACAIVGMLWFVNLTNFMDGVDLMSVAEFVPAFATIYILLAQIDGPGRWLGALCLASAGALMGFALLNKPPARLFLGDAGSLPLGLLGAIAVLIIGGAQGFVVALLPFLYYLADATLTLARRLLAGEKIWRPHRDHFYQRAVRAGMSTWEVIARVAICNILLCALALLAAGRSVGAQLSALLTGAAAVAWLMSDLVRKRS